MAVRIENTSGGADFGSALRTLTNEGIADRLDVMEVWQYVFNEDPGALPRRELTDLACRMFEDIAPESRASFVEAFRGGLDGFRRYMADYRRDEGRRAASTRQEMRERRRSAKPQKFGKSGLSI